MKRAALLRLGSSVILTIVFLFGGTKSVSADVLYTFALVNYPNAPNSEARGINNNDDVVGTFGPQFPPESQSFLRSSGTFSTIAYPGAIETFANKINNSDQIVGSYVDV